VDVLAHELQDAREVSILVKRCWLGRSETRVDAGKGLPILVIAPGLSGFRKLLKFPCISSRSAVRRVAVLDRSLPGVYVPLSPAISLALPGSGPPRKPLRLRYERRSRKGFCSRCCQLRCGSSGADHRLDQFVGKDLREDPSEQRKLENVPWQPFKTANAVYRRYGSAGVHRSGQFNGVRAVVWHLNEDDRQLVF